MTQRTNVRAIALCLFVVTFFSALGCNSAGSQAAGQTAANELSGPPVIIPAYQGRAPRQCSSVTSPPSVPQAEALMQCWSDAVSALGLFLNQDVKIQIGSSRPYILTSDSYLPQIDPTAKVYPIRGSYNYYACRGINNLVPAGKNCTMQTASQAMGMCWKTSFGDYKCFMQGPTTGNGAMGPAPTTY